jgi:hypothetical protein
VCVCVCVRARARVCVSPKNPPAYKFAMKYKKKINLL